MPTPMAVLGMKCVEISGAQHLEPQSWSWKPKVQNPHKLVDAMNASNNTSRNTFSSQVDHGENK